MAVTMAEAAKETEDALRRGVIETIVEVSPIAQYLPFNSIQGFAQRGLKHGTLPTVGFRSVNTDWTTAEGALAPWLEPLAILGGRVTVDRFLVEQGGNLVDIKTSQYDLKARAVGIKLSETFFEGDIQTDAKVFNGMRKRLTGNQLIDMGDGGGTLTLAKMDEAKDAVVGSPTNIFMNKTLRRKLASLVNDATSAAGHLRITGGLDEFGAVIQKYDGIPINVVEREDDASTILGFDEDDAVAGGGNMDTASIYFVRFGEPGLYGLQGVAGGPEVEDFGLIEGSVNHVGDINWYVGLAMPNPRYASRLLRINNA